MKRRYVLALCGVGIGSFTGCLDGIPDIDGDGEPSPNNETATETASRETTAPVNQDSERNSSPHEFVYVAPVEGESALRTAHANETVTFQKLSAQRQQTFREALDQERVAADEWSYYNESRPEYVRYNGSWFRVLVGVY